jgi:hypothetical protein
MLVPASILVNPSQALAQPQVNLAVINGGVHNIELKATQSADGSIKEQTNFAILPEDIVSVHQSKDFSLMVSSGMIESVKVTGVQLPTTELQLNGNVVKQNLAVGNYLLDIVVSMTNGDKHAFETILVVLAPTQTFTETNKQQVINTFVNVRVDTDIIFKDNPDPDPEPSICYFNPNDPRCDPNENGKCPNNWPMNEDGQCHPGGECPDGYGRVDDDETGTCYPDRDIVNCDNGAIVLHEEDCAIYDPPVTPTPTPTPEPQLKAEETPTPTPEAETEPEPEEPLDSNCGGVPCTASEKEDSTTSDPVPAEEPEPEEEEPQPEPEET